MCEPFTWHHSADDPDKLRSVSRPDQYEGKSTLLARTSAALGPKRRPNQNQKTKVGGGIGRTAPDLDKLAPSNPILLAKSRRSWGKLTDGLMRNVNQTRLQLFDQEVADSIDLFATFIPPCMGNFNVMAESVVRHLTTPSTRSR